MDKITLIVQAQQRRKSSIEVPSPFEVGTMMYDIDYLLDMVGTLTLQVETLQSRLDELGGSSSYDYNHYSFVEDLGG